MGFGEEGKNFPQKFFPSSPITNQPLLGTEPKKKERLSIMKIILAPDKFKGTLTAAQVTEIEKKAILSVIPEAEILCVPLADGGDGTVQALTTALGGKFETCDVRGPLGKNVTAQFGLASDCAILEMATASGMVLLTAEERNPMKTSTYGTGELIRKALESGVKEIVIGIGGSATVDGGAGMAEALGYEFFDKNGVKISGLCGGNLVEIGKISCEKVHPALKKCKFRIASDVTNPLLGENGSVAVFAPQKGATPEMMPLLENGLANLRNVLYQQGMISDDVPGDGAAGGLGLGLRAFCAAVPESGAKLAIKLTRLEEKLSGADLVITGEGCSDAQTENGKLCSELALFCKAHNVPCYLLSGKITENPGDLFAGFLATVPVGMPFEEIKPRSAELLYDAAVKFAGKIMNN